MGLKRNLFIIVGGSQSNVPFIHAAENMGYKTAVFDRNPSSPGAAIADAFFPLSTHDAEGILAECRNLSRRAPLAGIITYASYTMPLKAVSKVAEAFGLCSFSMQAVENTTNKARMKQRLYEAKIPSPEWLVTGDWNEAVSFLRDCRAPLVVKPASGSMGSSGISLVEDEEQLRHALGTASLVSENGLVILEKFYNAPEFSVDGIINKTGGTVLAVSEKFNLGSAHNFVISGFATGHSLEAGMKGNTDVITKVVRQAVEALGINNYFFSADVLLTDQGPLVLEVGLFLDAKIDRLLHFCGINVYEMLCCVACGLDIPNINASMPRGYALKFMFADRPGRLSVDSRVEPEILKSGGERWMVEWERQNGDSVRPPESIADTIGWVIAEGKDRASAYKLASKVASDYRSVVTT